MAKTTITAGDCGFVTHVTGECEDGQMVKLCIESNCENVKKLASLLPEMVDSFQEIGAGYNGVIFTTIREKLQGCCAGCIVPPGIFKTMQVSAGLALPQEPKIIVE